MKERLKKAAAALTALAAACSLAACSGKKSESSGDVKTAEKLADVAYKKEALKLPEKSGFIYGAEPYDGGTKRFLLGSADDALCAFWKAPADFSDYERVELPELDIGVNWTYGVAEDGRFAALAICADYGDLPDPDPSSPDYNEARYDAAAEYYLRLQIYSPEGEKLSDAVFEDFRASLDKYTLLGTAVFDGENVVCEIDGAYRSLSPEGECLGEIPVGEGVVAGICRGSSGKAVFAIETDDGELELREADPSALKLGAAETYSLGESVRFIKSGSGGYSEIIGTNGAAYGVKADGSIEQIFDFNRAGVSASDAVAFEPESGGGATICITDYAKGKSALKRFTACDPSELGDDIVVRIGVDSQYTLKDEVEEFNALDTGIRAERVIYEIKDDGKGAESPMSQFEEDAINGELPDVMALDMYGTFYNIDLMEKGALIDLKPYMEKDDELKPENLFPNLLEQITTDGKIYALPPRFYADMGLVCKKKWADELIKGEWNFDTYMDVVENLPEGMYLQSFQNSHTTKWSRFSVASWNWWTDEEKKTCNFDDEGFIRYLRYVAKGEDGDFGSAEEEYFADPDNPTLAEQQRFQRLQQGQYIDDKTLFDHYYLGGFEGYMNDIKGQFGGEELAYLGQPLPEGACATVETASVNFAITKDCDAPEEAWKFISFAVTNNPYAGNKNVSLLGFPITVKGFYELADMMRFDDKPRYPDQEGVGYVYFDGESYVNIGPLTDEDIALIYEQLSSAEARPQRLQITNPDYWEITNSEMNALVAGDSTPEQCAEYLQDRLSTFFSENYG